MKKHTMKHMMTPSMSDTTSHGDREPDTDRLLAERTAQQVIDTIKGLCKPSGELAVLIESTWHRNQRWARNRASMTSDQRDVRLEIQRKYRGADVRVMLNQIDAASLRGAVDLLEYYIRQEATNRSEDLMLESPRWETSGIPVWSDHTFARSAAENGQMVHGLTARAEERGLLSAGYFQTVGSNVVTYERDDWGRETSQTGRVTEAACSITVRHPKGTGSGWAGHSSFDLTRLNLDAVANRAFEKCVASLDPVRIEPGRYTTILEPQAVATFASAFVLKMNREQSETMPGPFYLDYDQALKRGRSKIGLRVMDARLTLEHNPTDPINGTHPEQGMSPIKLVSNGVMTSMFYRYLYAQRELSLQEQHARRSSFVLHGTETTSLEEMIATTKRGLLLTRVSEPEIVDNLSLLNTGVTRDGLWLIENGKISKAVRNFRWTESPLFIFNNVEQIGQEEPVYTGMLSRWRFARNEFQDSSQSMMVPPLKVNDFSFTSTIDAI